MSRRRGRGRSRLASRAVAYAQPLNPRALPHSPFPNRTKAASSLLLYQGVLKGKPAQAFLSVVQLLQKGSPLALLAAHGELYRLLADGGHASWLDYVLDQASCCGVE